MKGMDKVTEIPFPEMPRQYQLQRSVPDHEVVLVFRDDEHAEMFAEWLHSGGWAAFGAYADSR
jgi:hypothetical protein